MNDLEFDQWAEKTPNELGKLYKVTKLLRIRNNHGVGYEYAIIDPLGGVTKCLSMLEKHDLIKKIHKILGRLNADAINCVSIIGTTKKNKLNGVKGLIIADYNGRTKRFKSL